MKLVFPKTYYMASVLMPYNKENPYCGVMNLLQRLLKENNIPFTLSYDERIINGKPINQSVYDLIFELCKASYEFWEDLNIKDTNDDLKFAEKVKILKDNCKDIVFKV